MPHCRWGFQAHGLAGLGRREATAVARGRPAAGWQAGEGVLAWVVCKGPTRVVTLVRLALRCWRGSGILRTDIADALTGWLMSRHKRSIIREFMSQPGGEQVPTTRSPVVVLAPAAYSAPFCNSKQVSPAPQAGLRRTPQWQLRITRPMLPMAPAQSDDTSPLMSSPSLGCPQREA